MNLQASVSAVRTFDVSSNCSKSLNGCSAASGVTTAACFQVAVGRKQDESEAPTVASSLLSQLVPLDATEDQELRILFESVDEDGDGRITKMELANFMKKLNLSAAADQVQSILESADENGDGVLDFQEFVKLYHSVMKTVDCEDASGGEDEQGLLDAFSVFDSNNDGFISPSELQTVAQCFKLGRTVENCSDMIKAVDKDGDGLVNFQEFKDMMLSGLLP